MTELTREERERIYQEERTHHEARVALEREEGEKRESKRERDMAMVYVFLGVVLVGTMWSLGALRSTMFLVLAGAALYFTPSLVALNRRAAAQGMVVVVNVFLGWTFIGWIVALMMAYGPTRSPAKAA